MRTRCSVWKWLKPQYRLGQLNESRSCTKRCVFSVLLGSVWILLRGEIRPLWPWQGLVLLCHDASIAPYACLLPGPKTICCKLHYGLLRLICCLRTWCDWVSIQTTPLKLPASWPGHQRWQLQYRTVGATWSMWLLRRGNLLSALWSSASPA